MRPSLNYTSLSGTVLPIFVAEGITTQRFCGTGFLLGRGLFITCWHCISAQNSGSQRYVVGVPAGTEEECALLDLTDLERDEGSADLAIGMVEAEPTLQLVLGSGPYVLMGHDVWSFGYPYTDQKPSSIGGYDFTLNGRILRGYVTRTFPYDHPVAGSVDSYELDMPAPSGMSGAPLILKGNKNEVAGVIFGFHDVETIDESIEQASVKRVVSFSLAHTADTLRGIRSRATKGNPLSQFLMK